MSRIEITDLVKRYGAVEVIHKINSYVEEGEFAILVGPSGCGKSTLLRMIAGLEEITDGTISIGSTVVNDLAPKDRDIAMVFQNYALYPHMTVAKNMGYSLKIQGLPKDEIRKAVEDAADTLGLRNLLDRYPGQLSGGQRQRVAMGRAIVRKPSVFLFDEPLSNLDAKLRVRMRAEIKSLQQRLGTTTVYVTHDQIEAMTMADKIIVLDGGHISQVGTPLDLYDNPANRFVATFIGSPAMNILSCKVGPNGVITLSDGQNLDVHHAFDEGHEIEFGIRPEDLALSKSGEGAKATVNLVEPTGSESMINCTLAGQETLVVVKERVSVKPGDDVWLTPIPKKHHFFDASTGAVIGRD